MIAKRRRVHLGTGLSDHGSGSAANVVVLADGEEGVVSIERGGVSTRLSVRPGGDVLAGGPALGEQWAQDRQLGLGMLAHLQDSALVDSVLKRLNPADLGRMACCSRLLYAIVHTCEELWRTHVISMVTSDHEDDHEEDHDFANTIKVQSTWRDTYVALRFPRLFASKNLTATFTPQITIYSDIFFQPVLCASMAISEEWTRRNNCPRRSVKTMTKEEFVRDFEKPNQPVIITDLVNEWPAYQKWSREHLIENYGTVPFDVGPLPMLLADYFEYSDKTTDEQPLYLFDKHFARTAPQLARDYQVPVYFQEDLFSVLGEAKRPDYRWLIIGPKRSGSTFHIDPNATSAWNAVLSGSKKWIMFPPDCPPPGVTPSADMSEVTAPVSLFEWFLNFYPHLDSCEVPPVECVVNAGEVIFVPRGWWHAVLNLEECVAITQNYVSEQNLGEVLDFLKDKQCQVSGMRGRDGALLYNEFTTAMEQAHPQLMAVVAETTRLRAEQAKMKPLWERIKEGQLPSNGFSFNFF